MRHGAPAGFASSITLGEFTTGDKFTSPRRRTPPRSRWTRLDRGTSDRPKQTLTFAGSWPFPPRRLSWFPRHQKARARTRGPRDSLSVHVPSPYDWGQPPFGLSFAWAPTECRAVQSQSSLRTRLAGTARRVGTSSHHAKTLSGQGTNTQPPVHGAVHSVTTLQWRLESAPLGDWPCVTQTGASRRGTRRRFGGPLGAMPRPRFWRPSVSPPLRPSS